MKQKTVKSQIGRLFRLAVMIFAAFPAITAFAGRYWRGATEDALFSNTENWASDSHSGAGGNSYPGSTGEESTAYFCKIKNALCVIDGIYTLPGNVFVGTQSDDYFVWRATDLANGFSASSKELQIAANISNTDRTPAYLQIDSGTYSFGTTRIGYVNNGKAGLLFNGDSFTANKLRVGGGKTGVDGTLTIKGGTFATAATGDDVFMICDQAGTKGTLIIEGGTLTTTSGNQVCVGGESDVDAQIYIKKGGVWNAKKLFLGGKRQSTYSVANSVAKLVVDGGTLNLEDENGIGYAEGEGSYAEMIVNSGAVNCNYGYFYVAERAPGALTINGGTFTMTSNSSGGLTFGRSTSAAGILTLNGGVLATSKLRLDKLNKAGSKAIFNGGTLKALNATTSFINASDYIDCIIDEGGLIVDTAGYDITIKTAFGAAEGKTIGPIVKKGLGKLTLEKNFGGEIIVYSGTVSANGTTYEVNAEAAIDASAGGDLGVVEIHREKLEDWLKDADFRNVAKHGANGTAMMEQPEPVVIDVNGNRKTYINLETGKTYNDEISGTSFSFTTENLAPRTLQIIAPDNDPVENVRDIGSWPLMSTTAKKMKQGVILRGGHLDHFVNATAAQREASYLTTFGIKTEIDLRIPELDSVDSNVAGLSNGAASFAADGCTYYRFGLGWGDNAGTQIRADDNGNFTNQIRKVFATWGTEGNLPSYFHCQIGTDRTGVTGLLLLGMMGVEEEVLYRDYLMSNFANIGGSRDTNVPDTFIRYLLRGNCNDGKYVYDTKDAQYGVSIASRARQYLEMCGVTEAQLDAITEALSGETADEVLARVNAYERDNNVRTVSYLPYEGSTEVKGMHRLPAGEHLLPLSDPTRDGYIFRGWDTENEANGIVYALWQEESDLPMVRFWADENGDSESFARYASWDPAPSATAGFNAGDTLALNKGVDKIATLADGDSIAVNTVYVGWGTTNGTDMADKYDFGGRLDVSGGTLTVADMLWVGGSYSDKSNNVVNVTGGKIVTGKLRVSECGSNGFKKSDILNISGTGEVVVQNDEISFGRYGSQWGVGNSIVNITNGGKLTSAHAVRIGNNGKAVVDVDGGILDATGKDVYVGYSGTYADGTLNITNGTLNASSIKIANDTGSVGNMTISGSSTVYADFAFYVGNKGYGSLTINGGEVFSRHSILLADGSEAGADSELHLNGGVLKVGEIKASKAPATMYWNGGTLTRNDVYQYIGSTVLPTSEQLSISVLRGGAIYESLSDDQAEVKIEHPLSGVGAFVKRGGSVLTINGALDLKGGFMVEGGTLNINNLTRTYFKEISVDEDCTLNLNGATVTVTSYTVAGAPKSAGTYNECNGTIIVKSAESSAPATAQWTNLVGDGDISNIDNWVVYAADGTEVFDALPDANTAVYIPVGTVCPDLSGMNVKSVTLVAADSVFMRGDCTVPAVAKEAKCWFDFDDVSTVTLAGGSDVNLASIANKGTAKETLSSAVVYGDNDAHDLRDPRYGDNGINGRKIMLQTDLGDDSGAKSKCLRTEALGLEGDHDRALVVVSRRGSSTPHYPLGIEDAMYSDGNGHFRIERQEYSTHYFYCANKWDAESESFKPNGNDISTNQDPEGWAIRMFQSEKQPAEDCLVSTRVYSDANGLTTNSTLATNLNAQASARLYMGYRYLYNSPSRGQIAEAFYFDRALTTAEQEALQAYLYAKWFTPADMSNIPSNILLENGATLDFGGGSWTFDTIKGEGTIGTANITVTHSIEPGLTVGGSVTFAQGATIDMTPWDKVAPGTEMVFLTAESIANWPTGTVRSPSRICKLELVENDDGTVSLKGTIQAAGMRVILR